ncbi:alginate lyase family protein [uncultured Ferrimonas sp.]|uniref:heparinase II/III family protein n=1 Tax=uncultured Ferrimonas sp. TaxID=432640 RepID=UPI002624A37F|nr:alginate lyase family protein [uncultured Ferrimonas sp.]
MFGVKRFLHIITKTSLYFHTLRHLRFIQFADRIRRRLRRLDTEVASDLNLRNTSRNWLPVYLGNRSMNLKNEFKFLNRVGVVHDVSGWNDKDQEKLWLYNLHYFEDLVALDASKRNYLHSDLVDKWINENPPPYGNGWEPYPQSLRIVNWIKWFLNGADVKELWLSSLAQQVYVLSQQIEYHLLGNHLFANGKALIFAGLYFDGDIAEKWLQKGISILDKELEEQVQLDGGNFELSPMYHNIQLQDLLDLINLANTYNHPLLNSRITVWRQTAAAMIGWMKCMTHPDGEVSLFNDSAIGIAPSAKGLIDYACAMEIHSVDRSKVVSYKDILLSHFIDTGYIRVNSNDSVALLDCARVGPDYIPGHAHADTLSFELSLFDQRLFVNSGTGCYGLSEERLRQRKTASHNTVTVDERDSSEVWGGFRVARRAYPSTPVINVSDGISVSCSHNGYGRLNGNVTHHRKWQFDSKRVVIRDRLEGKFSKAQAHYHIHPEVDIQAMHGGYILTLLGGQKCRLRVANGCANIEDSTWHPEFGLSIKSKKVVVTFNSPTLTISIDWD